MTPRSLLAPARLAGRSVLATQTDERLVDLARAGSGPAFEAIVARYRGPLLGYCGKLLNKERAEDAVQQTFVKAYDKLTSGDGELKLRPWLYRVAHNTALNALRDRSLRHEPLDDRMDGIERPDQAAERRQGLRDVFAAIGALPPRQRDAMVLRELEGRSYEEIAGQLGVTGGSVRALLNRARTSLRAGVTAVTPVGLLLRLPVPLADAPVTARVAELCAAGGGGALAAKVCATAIVTGAVAGGVTGVPGGDEREPARARADTPAAERAAPRATAEHVARTPAKRGEHQSGEHRSAQGDDDRSGPGPEERVGDRHREGTGDRGDERQPTSGDRSGPGVGDTSEPRLDSSGPGPGSDELMTRLDDHSGPGSGEEPETDNSGPGSSH